MQNAPNFRPLKYAGPEQTQAVKAESLQHSIDFAIETLEEVGRGKVDLSDPEAIRLQAVLFLKACGKAGVIPTFEKFIASCGYSRQWVHRYRREHAGSPSVIALDNIHTVFTNVMTEQALYRNFSEAVTIFLLKNAQGQEYSDKVEFEQTIVPARRLPTREELETQVKLLDSTSAGEDNEWILEGWPETPEEFENQR